MKEIRSREPSPSGTPPFTHTGAMRNSIVYAYDQSSQSVVIGGFMQGIPEILNLHEFGGWQTMQAWAWIPGEGRRFSGLIGWWAVGRAPRMNPGQWQPMQPQWKEVFQYPKRPYMRPALFAAIKRNEVVRQFAGNVRIGG
ncbi:MAG: hypothetical protein EBR82_34725 [Caulobacteraceae bacterium]|nr:hypothetical protein [Caulobacteraceae bacterium]